MLLAVQSIQSAQSLLFFVCPVQAYPGAFPTLIGYAWGPGIDVLISEAKEPGYERGKMLLSAGLFYMHHHLPSAQINTFKGLGNQGRICMIQGGLNVDSPSRALGIRIFDC